MVRRIRQILYLRRIAKKSMMELKIYLNQQLRLLDQRHFFQNNQRSLKFILERSGK
jgi:hypothetical protein